MSNLKKLLFIAMPLFCLAACKRKETPQPAPAPAPATHAQPYSGKAANIPDPRTKYTGRFDVTTHYYQRQALNPPDTAIYYHDVITVGLADSVPVDPLHGKYQQGLGLHSDRMHWGASFLLKGELLQTGYGNSLSVSDTGGFVGTDSINLIHFVLGPTSLLRVAFAGHRL